MLLVILKLKTLSRLRNCKLPKVIHPLMVETFYGRDSSAPKWKNLDFQIHSGNPMQTLVKPL